MKKNLKFFLAKVFFAVGLCAALQAQSSELESAILNDDENAVRKLLDQGADANAVVNKDGMNALGLAILNDKENMVRLLLENGADANAVVDKYGTNALGCAIQSDTENIVRLLLEKGADVNAVVRKDGTPALTFAILCDKENIVRLLLEKGADPNASGDSASPAIRNIASSNRPADYLAMMEPYIHDYSIPRSYDKAHSYRTGEPYPSMKDIPSSIKQLCRSNPEKAIDEICKIIRREAKNDFEKAKMAHDYVAMNITYDMDTFRRITDGITTDEPDQGWKIVLRDGKAVCAGYSSLFKKFMDELNIKCDLISGFAKGEGDLQMTGGLIKTNHAWNVACLEGAWYIVDSTWDGDKDTEQKNNAYSTEYLFMKPEDFIRDHYPVVKKHQLLQKPLTPEQFVKSLEN